MAVDANVLVFERMREEKERGASLAQQIRNGFNRAWVTIFDSHVTNFLAPSCSTWSAPRRSRASRLTMIIGMAWNLFTAVFMSRVIFEFCYTKGWLKNVTMLKMMDKTNIDFIGPRYYCMAGSLILIVLGLIATARPRSSRCSTSTSPAAPWSRSASTRTIPSVKPLTESQRAQLRSREGERLARRDRREPAGERRQEPGPVQHPHDRTRPEQGQAADPRGVRLRAWPGSR